MCFEHWRGHYSDSRPWKSVAPPQKVSEDAILTMPPWDTWLQGRTSYGGLSEIIVTPGANAQSVAELTIGLMLAAARKVVWMDSEIRAGRWSRATGR